MRHAILVTGANCSGKTTSVNKALKVLEAEGRRVTDHAFDMEVGAFDIGIIRADNNNYFKGKADEQRSKVTDVWLSLLPVLIIEGTRINTPVMDVSRAYPGVREFTTLMTQQPADVMLQHLKDRCVKAEKPFNEPYWTRKKLEYEGMKRYYNKLRAEGVRPVVFTIDKDYLTCEKLVEHIVLAVREALK